MIDYEQWIVDASERINQLKPSDGPFALSDVFERVVWNELENKDRRALGRQFSNAVQSGRVPNVRLVDNKSRGTNRYEWIEEED